MSKQNEPIATSDGRPILSIQEQLQQLQLQELLEKQTKEREDAATAEKHRQARLEDIREGARKKKADQLACSHIKPNGYPNVGGQKDHQGIYHFVCSYCMSEWTQATIPANLAARINMEHIGGPSA